MTTEKLLKTIPIIQNQMDVLLDFNVSAHYFLQSLGDTCFIHHMQSTLLSEGSSVKNVLNNSASVSGQCQ